MKAFSKIGFHTSVGGSPSGIGDHLRRLDAAGVPFFIKAADSMTGLFDAQILMRKSSVPHTAVFRRSIRYNGCAPIENPDVPDYNLDPEEAARDHWQWHKAGLPPELDKDLVWIETINEVRTEVQWADWLGNFAYHSAQMMMADGYHFSAFGYSSGTPDEGSWETDGMLRYLELCQQHPDKASVSLHEYSYKVNDIWFLRGDHIGRFEQLFAACDKHKIKRPNVLITEWGWTYNDLPDVQNAMKDIAEVAEYYARFPELLGAAIWWLGPGFGGIAKKAQKLIKPVTDYNIATRFDVPDPEEKDEEKPVFPTPIAPPPVDESQLEPNGRFISDVTIPDDTHVTAGQTFTKTWRVENNGQTTWGAGYKFVHTDGEAMTDVRERPLPVVAPGEQVEISIDFTAPNTPGAYFGDWRFQTPDGRQFGDIIYTRLIADPPPPDPAGVSDGRWVADVTIPDDMEIKAGADFTKTWRARNSGSRAWGAGFTLEFAGGTPMNFQATYPLPAAAPGQEVEISVPLRAPMTPGTHYADFRMKDEKGNFFGEILYARIVVPKAAVSTLTPPLSQRDPRWAGVRLGHASSPKTIGEWGCLLTCFTMVANAFGRSLTPDEMNHAMVSNGGFLNGYLTKWNALSDVYKDVVYQGKLTGPATPDLLARIDSSLAAGRPVTIQVDFTSNTPYTDNDQHWVLIVAKDGDDYRINDPWLLPGQEASLKARYGRAGRPLRDAIMTAVFYRSAAVVQPQPITPPDHAPGVPVEAPTRLQTGMNVNPDAPNSNPYDNDDLKGMDWVRFVFKLDARVNVSERGHINKAFAQYDPIVRAYNKMGVKTLFVINQETIWGSAPWNSGSGWRNYAANLAETAHEIARHYRRYGDNVGYEIWNEGDKPHNPASVFVPADKFAIILKEVAGAIRAQSPDAPLVFGGLATGPEEGIAYLKKCKAALNGPWPVDAIGIHPYTRWATRAPFDWGQHYGTLGQAFAQYRAAFPDIPFWITELGVADDNEIGSQFYPEIGDYLKDVYSHVAERHTGLVPVVIWFAWSDWMRNAGIVDRNGNRKPHVYPAFRAVRNRELKA